MTPAFDPKVYTLDARRNWSAAAPHYDKMSADHFLPITKTFIEFCGLRPGQRVLDVACGPGTATWRAAEAVGITGKVVGVDLSMAMLKIAAEKVDPQKSCSAVEFREMNAENLDFPDKTFDAVICQLGLMLFADPNAALREMVRALKKGGAVSCLVQGTAEKMVFTSLLNRSLVKYAPQIKTPGAPTLYAYGSAGTLDQTLRDIGLVRIKSQRKEGVFVFDSIAQYWTSMTSGAGRTGAILKSLEPGTKAKIKEEVYREMKAFVRKNRLEVPYEVVMAKGVKP
jgi:ubiquinone/menaquinone biosynthesis C-methylase UbiE